MKIAYVFSLSPDLSTGVFKKIKSQIRQWQAAGHTVRAYHVRPVTSEFDPSALHDLESSWRDYVRPLGISGIVERINTWRALVKDVIEWDPDVAYYRYSRFWPGLGRLGRNIPIVTEMNTVQQEYFDRSKKWYYYHKVTKPYFFRQVDGIVCVSEQICREYTTQNYPNKQKVIANGINLENYEVLPPSDSTLPELVFIGHGHPWDGIDKIQKLATLRPHWQFHIVGDIDECNVDRENIYFHGYMDRNEYQELFRRADVGIGTLALHRKNMSEASALKVREYLAFGLPVIIAYDDSDFLNSPSFLLQLPNYEENIETELERIDKFLQEWKGKRVDRQAVEHIDARRKEMERLEFFRSVVDSTEK